MNTKVKSEIYIGVLLVLVFLIGVFFWILRDRQQNEKYGLSQDTEEVEPKSEMYYEKFRSDCQDSSCCISSVDNAEKNDSFVYSAESLEEVDCPEGKIPETSKCPDSYKWCISAEN